MENPAQCVPLTEGWWKVSGYLQNNDQEMYKHLWMSPHAEFALDIIDTFQVYSSIC